MSIHIEFLADRIATGPECLGSGSRNYDVACAGVGPCERPTVQQRDTKRLEIIWADATVTRERALSRGPCIAGEINGVIVNLAGERQEIGNCGRFNTRQTRCGGERLFPK